MGRMVINAIIALCVAVVLGMAGCGGGSEGGNPSPGNASPPMVSGIASEGVLITGKTVRLKDANGKSAPDTTTDLTTGSYSIDVTGLIAPYLVAVTGANGSYVSFAQTTGTANINPITTTVVALAAGTSDVPALFSHHNLIQTTTISSKLTAKSELITSSLQAALPSGSKAEDYFTGAVTAGIGIDAVFDSYKITVDPSAGITVRTKDVSATTVLSVPVAVVTANTNQPLPALIAPIAKAGMAQNVVTGASLTLNGSGSTAPNGGTLSYQWSITSKPHGSIAALSNATVANPTFTPDVAGSYVFKLVVNDGKVNSSAAMVTISASEPNVAPVASAGTSQSVAVGTVVTLNGSGSDANGDVLAYCWEFASRPSGSHSTLSSTIVAKPTFTPDVAGIYVLNLVVNDGKISSAIATVSVTVSVANVAPVAKAGADQTAITGSTVFISGSESFDPNGDAITFRWSFASIPSGSAAELSSTTVSSPHFVADVAGSYVLSLIVGDNKLSSSDSVTITAIGSSPPPSKVCCRVCTTGKPCGDSCISKSYTCHIIGGCAC